MKDTKGKQFRMGKLLVQYWYKGGKRHTKKLMIIGIGTKVFSRALVYGIGKTFTRTTFWERALRDY